MKINESNSIKKVSFQGHQHEKTESGEEAYRFNCLYDKNKYDCEVQFFKVGQDKKNNFFIEKGCNGTMEPFYSAEVGDHGVQVDADYDLDLQKNEPFAYRFKLKSKDGSKTEYPQSNGFTIDGCSVITRRGTSVTKQGPMYLTIADTFNPGYVYAGFNDADTGKIKGMETADKKKEVADKVRNSNRTFSNTIGGTMAGIEVKIPELRKAGFKRIITCPLKGGDNASSHKYWNENNFLMAGGIGNINNYNSLQRTAFRHGMNLVDDGTFTSEGLQGVHFQRAIKWMDPDNKPDEYYMFRMSGLQDDSLGLGVVPENYKNMRLKVVNGVSDYEKQSDGQYKIVKNKDYNPKQPTYIQLYDDTMVSDEQRADKTHVITQYDKVNADSSLSANTHDDTPVPYTFEATNPYELDKNIKSLNEVNQMRGSSERIDKDSPAGAMFLGSLSNIKIAPKEEGGFVCWDANTDMVKMNYFTSNYDDELLASEKDSAKRAIEMDKYRRANYQVQDMTLAAGRYWTKEVRNTHNEYVAKTIGEISSNPTKAFNRIDSILNSQNPEKPVLPEDVRVSKSVVENVLNGDYLMREKSDNYDDLVNSAIMDLPLDSLEFANDTAGALSSPYISKRSTDEEHLGQTRFESINDPSFKVDKKYAKTFNKMNDVYTKDIKGFADKVLNQVNENSKEKLFDEEGEVTEYGQYVIPLVAGDIAKYALVKSLMPSVKAKQIDGGEIAYDYDTMREEGTLRNLGINGDSQEDEANQVVNKISKGVNLLKSSDVDFVSKSINKRIQNTNANSFKLAEVMVDRSGLGLDWRLDAAKDVADMDSVRNMDQTFDKAWDNVVKFWGNFVDTVKEENPNSYLVAEITDVGDLIKSQPDDKSDLKYNSEEKSMNSLFNVAGITSEANYSYFFDGITSMFAKDFTNGNDNVNNNDNARVGKLEDSISRFVKMPLDYQRNSYVFASNHDKPRMIHFMSMDMGLYHSDLKVGRDNDRKIAYMITHDKMDIPKGEEDKILHDPDMFNNVSAKAVANGALLRNSIGAINEQMKQQELRKIDNSDKSEHEKNVERENIHKKYDAIYSALSGAVADVVNGKYYKNEDESKTNKTPDSIKKINEKDGFGSKPIPTAFDIVYDQAVHSKKLDKLLSGDEKETYKDAVYMKATEVGRAKTRIITRYLSALSGNPTIYAGDEGLAMTGAEDKCQNTFLQNRNALDWSLVDKDSPNANKDVQNFMNDMFGITRVRMDDNGNKMEALNNGTMTKLVTQNRYIFADKHNDNKQCPAVIYQAGNGAMSVSLFNPNGITTAQNVSPDDLHPNQFTLEGGINLEQDVKGRREKISLTPGTEFKNANNPDYNYRVFEHDGNYCIKQIDSNGKESGIELNEKTAPDGVLMLYHVPEDIANERSEMAETKKREYYNKQHNIMPNGGYQSSVDEGETGHNLNVTSEE